MLNRSFNAERLGFKQDGGLPLRMLGEAGNLWHQLGDHQRASNCFEALCLLAPDDPVGPVGMAQVMLARKLPRKSIRYADDAIRRQFITRDVLALAYLVRGEAAAALGRVQEARRDFARSAEVGGDLPIADSARFLLSTMSPEHQTCLEEQNLPARLQQSRPADDDFISL